MTRLFATLAASALSLAILGGAAAAPCPGTRLDIVTPPLAATPYVTLELDGRRGPWLIDLGATATTVSSRIWQAPAPGEPSASPASASSACPQVRNPTRSLRAGRTVPDSARRRAPSGRISWDA